MSFKTSAALIAFTTAVFGQSTPAPKAFEVASIKPNQSGGHNIQIGISPGGRFTANNVTLRLLIQQAYGIKDFQISGGPGWIGSERFDINAKVDDSAAPGRLDREQLQPMLQALLTDRFKLSVHRDAKELPIYALIVGKNGPKIHPSETTSGAQMRMGRGRLGGQKVTMQMLASQLSGAVGRSVTDKTGLKGDYDFNLEWTPDEGQMPPGHNEGGERPPGETSASSETGSSIFTAVQEQLGLKLEAQKGPVEILVIDHVEKPTEN